MGADRCGTIFTGINNYLTGPTRPTGPSEPHRTTAYISPNPRVRWVLIGLRVRLLSAHFFGGNWVELETGRFGCNFQNPSLIGTLVGTLNSTPLTVALNTDNNR